MAETICKSLICGNTSVSLEVILTAALGLALLRLTIAHYVTMRCERDAVEFLHKIFPRPAFDA